MSLLRALQGWVFVERAMTADEQAVIDDPGFVVAHPGFLSLERTTYLCTTTLDAVEQTYLDLGDSLLLASRALVGVAARSLADEDSVTLPQFRALVCLGTRERTTVSELAQSLGVHSTSATRLCDRLVRKRLIRRTEGAEDRRATDLHLTAAGRRLVDRVTERRRRDLGAIAGRMGEASARDATAALEAFAAAADEAISDANLFGWQVAP